MTDFSDLLLPQTVSQGIALPGKKAVLQHVATIAAAAHGVDQKAALTVLADRERLGSTGFGGGIAIPHGRLDGIAHPVGVFVRLAEPIDFQSVDDLPVDLIFMMLSSPDAGADHLKSLARISRRLRDRHFVAKLRGAGSPDALYALWTAEDARDAA